RWSRRFGLRSAEGPPWDPRKNAAPFSPRFGKPAPSARSFETSAFVSTELYALTPPWAPHPGPKIQPQTRCELQTHFARRAPLPRDTASGSPPKVKSAGAECMDGSTWWSSWKRSDAPGRLAFRPTWRTPCSIRWATTLPRAESFPQTGAYRHICWDGGMFPNAMMTSPETWVKILATLIRVRDAHGWD